MRPSSVESCWLTRRKVYIGVLAYHAPDGTTKPLKIVWEDGRKFPIERVLDVRRAASRKIGGQGMRYLVKVAGHEVEIYEDELDHRWFTGAK